MKYLLMINSDEKLDQSLSPEQLKAMFGDYHHYTESLKESSAYIGGEPLESVSTATSVRVREDSVVTTDGPFAETKEQMGGCYLIDVPNLDEAIRWASKVPHAKQGSIEVRPVMALPS